MGGQKSAPLFIMIINTKKQLDELLASLKDAELVSFDYETLPSGEYPQIGLEDAALHHKACIIEGLSLRSEEVSPVYIPFIETKIPREELIMGLRGLFQQESLFIAHNMQFDAKLTDYFLGVRPKNKFCTLVGYWLLDENAIKSKVVLGKQLFGMETVSYKEAKNLSGDVFLEYVLRDAEFAYQLYLYLKEHLEPAHFDLASTLEMDFVDVLIDMTLRGTPCDLEYLKQGEELFTNKALELEAEIYREYGEFNVGSSQQVCEKVYGIKIKRSKKDGLSLTKVDDYSTKKYAPVTQWNVDKNDKTKKTTPSTDEKALDKLNTPVANLLKEYRGIKKLLSTYAIGYQKYVLDGKIYPTFNNSPKESFQYGTTTGRLSSSAPNMQNISHEPTEGWWLRDAIHASPGYKLIVADEAQLEVRILAHFSKDENLMGAIWSGEDIHSATAKLLYLKDDISSEERRFAKIMNFSIPYGQGVTAVAAALKTDFIEARDFINLYYRRFPGVKSWILDVGRRVTSYSNIDHSVKTILGRKRRFPELPIEIYPSDTEEEAKKKQGKIAHTKRQAVNSIVQGSASDVLKVAMVRISQEIKEKNLDAHILLQIHDELVVEVKEEQAEEVAEIVKRHMERPFQTELRVPLEVNPVICALWSEGK